MTEPLDAVGHLLAELHRLELILRASAGSAGKEWPAGWSRTAGDPGRALAEHAAKVRGAVQAAIGAGARLPLLEMCRTLGLDEVSIGLLMLALAPHVDRRFERIYAWLQGAPSSTAPRLELALEVFGAGPAERFALRDRFLPDAPLVRSGFFRLVDPPEGPQASMLSQVLWVSPRLLRFLTDRLGAEPEVEAVRALEPLPPPTRGALDVTERFAAVWRISGEGPAPLGVIASEDTGAVLASAAELAESAEVPALLVDLARPGAGKYPVERCVEAVLDEARLLGALVAVAGFDELDERLHQPALDAVVSGLGRFDGPCLLVTRAAPDLRHELRRRRVLSLEAPLPDVEERRALWTQHLEGREALAGKVPEIAARYRLGSGQIRDAARMAEALEEAEGPSAEHLRTASQAQSRHGLGQLAQRVAPWGSWDDLVLPAESVQKLRNIAEHILHREQVFSAWGLGAKVSAWRGASALFVGPPGTGKTLSASLVAQALGLELFRIDLAGVVSKYIGETEKNLDRVFRAAHRSNAVLFFDEADALFGKRTEVKDAHDRHANVETSYLLQKLESFEGLSILATNLKKNIDAAFLRRIDVMVEFPFPRAGDRRRLWGALMPRSMPRAEDVDFDFLAERFELSGGDIKNAIQAAALRAAAEGGVVEMGHLLASVRWELQKHGKTVEQSDLEERSGATAEPRESTATAPRPSRARRGAWR